MQTVSVTNDSLTHIFKMFPFETFRVKTLCTITVTVHLLFEMNLFTNESSKDNCMRKNFSRLALLSSILDIVLVTIMVMAPADMLLFPSSTPIFLRSILGQVTPVAYLTLGLGCHLIETN